MKDKSNPTSTIIDVQVPVLIVGGGISGLTAALFLLKQGVKPLLIEGHLSTSIHPRARGFDVRTMELYRELQLSELIREAGKALAPAWGIHKNVSLAETLKNKKPRKGKAISSPVQTKGLGDLAALSPEVGARCTQDLSEPVLLQAAKEWGADVRFYTELVSFEQDDRCVTAKIKDRATGEVQTVSADYMIAADGANSGVREALHAKTVGAGSLGNLLNIYFEADLGDFVRGREFSMIKIYTPETIGLLTAINNSDRWVFHLRYDPGKGERPEDYPEERIAAILKKIIGLPDVKIRVISVLPWQPTVKIVTDMQHGRIFLAGDAAHVMTPYGGKGANTGVQDVHNLAWKLATVVHGKASPALLKTYSAERQPIGQYNAEQSGKMTNKYGLPNSNIKLKLFGGIILIVLTRLLGLKKLFPHLAVTKLGGLMGLADYSYSSTAVVDNEPTRQNAKQRPFTGAPGTRVPHIWVEYNGQKISTLDLLGKDFVLFTGIDNTAWQKTADDIKAEMQIPVSIYSIGAKGNLIYNEKSVNDIFGIKESGALLIRPDGFVAWRSEQQPLNTSDEMKKCLGQCL